MIVITTPTGAIGRLVLQNLLGKGQPIRVIVRDPSRLPPQIREQVDVVEGSHGDAAVVDRAFAGAEVVFWLVPPDPRSTSIEAAYVDFSRPACAAIRSQGVKRVVGVSAVGRGAMGDANLGPSSASWAMDDLIAGTGVGYRALTMPSMMDNLLWQVDPIRNAGLFFSPIDGDLKAPTCAKRDIAAVAARLLVDPSWTGRDDVPVLGPEDLSFNDMAAIMADVLGKPVRFQQIPMEGFRSQLLKAGQSEPMAQAMVDMLSAKNNGLDNHEPRTPQSTTPTSFRTWCEDVLKPAVLG